MKTCSKCNTEKELTEYSKRKDSRDGYFQYCKLCAKTYIKHDTNALLKRASYQKRYRLKQKEKLKCF